MAQKLRTGLACLAAAVLCGANGPVPGQQQHHNPQPVHATAPNRRAPMPDSPLEIVQQRMRLYNAHDLEGFLALYSPDIAIYDYPDTFFGRGLDHMRGIFAPMFGEGKVRVEVGHQLVSDVYVINEEIVTYPDDRGRTRYVSIYEVREGKIQSVRFVRDAP